jgi:hypothetical protein
MEAITFFSLGSAMPFRRQVVTATDLERQNSCLQKIYGLASRGDIVHVPVTEIGCKTRQLSSVQKEETCCNSPIYQSPLMK